MKPFSLPALSPAPPRSTTTGVSRLAVEPGDDTETRPSRHADAILEHGAGAGLRGDAARPARRFCSFRAFRRDRDRAALDQFEIAPMVEAAALLADARVQALCWNGTSASWLGLARDRALCAAITARTGIPATSSVLALEDIFRRSRVARFGLVTPYLGEVQARIVANFQQEGFACAAERHLGISDNFAFSEVAPETLAALIREVAAARPQAIAVLCTNLRAAGIVERLEREIGIPIHDSVATALWSSLRLAGVAPSRVAGWGLLFREVA
jgi:maleate isomerase